jgi:hypothetical protein
MNSKVTAAIILVAIMIFASLMYLRNERRREFNRKLDATFPAAPAPAPVVPPVEKPAARPPAPAAKPTPVPAPVAKKTPAPKPQPAPVAKVTRPVAPPSKPAPLPPAPEPVAPPPPPPPPAEPVPPEWRGQDTAVKHSGQIVVKNDRQWIRFWGEHHPHEAAPEIDFSRFTMIGVFAGPRPAEPFAISIVNVKPTDSAVLVDYREINPPTGTFAVGVTVHPYHLKAIPKTTLPVKFNKLQPVGQ